MPTDRRVWLEALTLTEAGYQVSVICPQRGYLKLYERVQGISIYRYPLPSLTGIAGHLVEYVIAMPITLLLAWVVLLREGFDVIHAANPPDFFYLIARVFKVLGKKFIFDHRDAVPEACLSRWSGFKLLLTHSIATWTERATFRTADVVISTNQSYRRIAVERGRVDSARVFVVRSAIRKADFREGQPRSELRRRKKHLVCFLGVIGPNDGLEYFLLAIDHIVGNRHRDDIHFAIVGNGDLLHDIVGMSDRLRLGECIDFTGFLSNDKAIADYLATADVCVSPDPKNPFNDICTMEKVVEYMAMGKPLVAFDLHEVRDTARGAGLYVEANDPRAFGDKILELLDSPETRRRMGELGRQRFNDTLAWEHQRESLLKAYELLGTSQERPTPR
ncbi:MAG: glycosyltransferase family 4 protein [Candidatus Dormibacteraeota bacterium]|nr:glycosyltransferase family 4 protein [Candidatus Dormibacteraeota bacterium]